MHILEPTFRTLKDAGYTECKHPRQEILLSVPYGSQALPGLRCMDCGALNQKDGGWAHGVLDYPRKWLLVP